MIVWIYGYFDSFWSHQFRNNESWLFNILNLKVVSLQLKPMHVDFKNVRTRMYKQAGTNVYLARLARLHVQTLPIIFLFWLRDTLKLRMLELFYIILNMFYSEENGVGIGRTETLAFPTCIMYWLCIFSHTNPNEKALLLYCIYIWVVKKSLRWESTCKE